MNLPVHTSIFTAEAVALKLAVQCIQRQVVRKSVIYSDSLSCLQALENKNLQHPVIRDIIQVLTYMNEVGSVIKFCWIPGRVSIKGNEQADQTARRIINHSVHDTKILFLTLNLASIAM